GLDAGLVDALVLDPQLGCVGKPQESDPRLLELLCVSGYLPIVACIAGDSSGTIYNVNADQMAVACATAFRVSSLLFLTDVEGVRESAGRILTTVSAKQAEALIRDGVATGGMQAKLEAAMLALENGVPEVRIAPGANVKIVKSLLMGEDSGTRLIA